ncbi:MAG TPA: ABC transporter substrate-binding protein [Candidatus Limnocylindrales bacterium]|nr:ABC transporter substrate-binding protein [Candidatus Limnocylindrales bacterium]
MKIVRLILFTVFCLAQGSAPWVIFAATPATRVPIRLRIAYSAPIGVMAPLWMAAESGALKGEGLEVEMVLVEARAAIAALIAKEIDVLEISMPAVVPAALAGGDITMIAGLLNKMIFSLHAQKEIRTIEQLRGKVFGSDRVGTASDYGGRTALSLLGIKETDVSVVRLGSTNVLWPALQSGQIAAAPLTPPQSFNADSLGYHRLVNTYHLPYQNIGIVLRKSDVEPKADAWLRLLRAMRHGVQRWYDDAKFARDVLSKYTKEKDPDKLQKTYEFFSKQAGFSDDLQISEPGTQQILSFLGSTVLPAAKGASPKQFYDTRILERLTK